MPVISLFALVLLGAQTGEPFRWKEVVPAGTTVEVRGIIGGIRAVAAGGNEAEVVGTRHRGEKGEPDEVLVRVIREGSRIILCTIYPRDSRWNQQPDSDRPGDSCEQARREAPLVRGGNDTRIAYEVRIPAGVNFVGQTVTEGVVLEGLRGNAEGYSVAGDVRITDVRGPVIDAASISGDITFDRVDAAEVYAGTLSGDVVFTGSVQRNGDYSFLSYTGELTVTIPGASGVTFSVISKQDDIQSSVALSPLSATSRRRFSGKQGNGSARMNLTTLNGEVRIRAAE